MRLAAHATVLLVEDVGEAAYNSASDSASRSGVVQDPQEQPYGLRELRVRDPDGYILAFGKLRE